MDNILTVVSVANAIKSPPGEILTDYTTSSNSHNTNYVLNTLKFNNNITNIILFEILSSLFLFFIFIEYKF